MTEGEIKGEVVSKARAELRRFVLFRHEDKSTFSVPDLSVTGGPYKITSWWEFKLADPEIKHRPNQELMMRRLGNVGRAYYVIFEDDGSEKWTRIVEPSRLSTWQTSSLLAHGFNYKWVVERIAEVHSV